VIAIVLWVALGAGCYSPWIQKLAIRLR